MGSGVTADFTRPDLVRLIVGHDITPVIKMPEAQARSDHLADVRNLTGHGVLDASLALAPGEILGLLGPNGAGKSTLVKSVAGRVHPDSGEVRILGNLPSSTASRATLVSETIAGTPSAAASRSVSPWVS